MIEIATKINTPIGLTALLIMAVFFYGIRKSINKTEKIDANLSFYIIAFIVIGGIVLVFFTINIVLPNEYRLKIFDLQINSRMKNHSRNESQENYNSDKKEAPEDTTVNPDDSYLVEVPIKEGEKFIDFATGIQVTIESIDIDNNTVEASINGAEDLVLKNEEKAIFEYKGMRYSLRFKNGRVIENHKEIYIIIKKINQL